MKNKSKVLVVGNWKANPDSVKIAKGNIREIRKFAAKYKKTEVVICPPTIFLETLKGYGKPVILGAQDIFPESSGAFTGSTGYLSLLETKIKYVIIGHSERRAMGEDNMLINRKLKVALSVGLSPIVCIGEEKRDSNLDYLNFIKTQLVEAFKDVPKSKVKDVIIAYEPIWAIGSKAKRDAKASEIEEMVILIRRIIGDLYQTKSVPPVRILYGGSVSPGNASYILEGSGVNGFLIGRASLTPKIFGEIIRVANEF
jgi:triosephosphate isomerase